jgi:hypothetical protein
LPNRTGSCDHGGTVPRNRRGQGVNNDPEQSDAYQTLLENYRQLGQAVRMIRQAVDETYGPEALPRSERFETLIQECEAIVKAIYQAGAHAERRSAYQPRPF